MCKIFAKTLPILFSIISFGLMGQDMNQVGHIKVKKVGDNGTAMLIVDPDSKIVCEAGTEDMPRVPLPEALKNRINSRIKTSDFEVTYSGFSDDAKAAFQYAVDIWAATFSSPVPVRIKATYRAFEEQNILGQAKFISPFANFRNVPKRNTWYQLPVAEKIAGEDLNGPGLFDIDIEFNSTANWYFDINDPDAIDGTGQTDFATVVLHELAHALGFSAFVSVDEVPPNSGDFLGEINLGTNFPMAYTTFLHTGQGENIVKDLENNSSEMASALTTTGLRFIGPTSSVRVYTPDEFNAGSSISHIDQIPNELMNPSLGPNGYIHDPGRALGMMNDYGWEFTYMIHDPLFSTENFDQSFEVLAEVYADNGYDTASLELHYSIDAFQTDTVKVALTPTGDKNMFSAIIPNPGQGRIFSYYLTVNDKNDRVFHNPGFLNDGNFSFFQFVAAIDDSIPTISHTPLDFLLPATPDLKINASIEDFFTGVDTAYVSWFINDTEQEPVGMTQDQVFTAGWEATIDFDNAFNIGDVIKYQIVAIDNANVPLTAVAPNENDFFLIPIEGIPEPTAEYTNDFNTPTTDFLGINFSVQTPNGFSDGALHSIHPYDEAGEGNEINYISQLRVPIIIDAANSTMQFDEIVLVEPGENGTLFGQEEFWDYVIVEGSSDEGNTWVPLVLGYDSRAQTEWLQRYNGGLQGQNSIALGDPGLFKRRTINLTGNGAFEVGETIIIRFRLFSDPFAVGWGWAIDNLQIQGEPIVAISDGLEDSNEFRIYPNPSESGLFNVEGRLYHSIPKMQIKVLDAMGRIVVQKTLSAPEINFSHLLDLSDQPAGMYIFNATTGIDQVTQKIIKSY